MLDQRFFPRLFGFSPVVVCLTSPVASRLTADCLTALGAVPAMPSHPSDVAYALGKAHSLLVNIGGLDHPRLAAIKAGIKTARRSKTPWVLDPVGMGGSPWRSRWARWLEAQRPTIIKGNAAEIRALAGQKAALAGMDSLDQTRDAEQAALTLARRWPSVLVTGASDLVQSPNKKDWLDGGHALTPQLTATGCALGAVVAACLAQLEPHKAGVTGATLFNQAAEQAGPKAKGLGSFATEFFDALGGTQPELTI